MVRKLASSAVHHKGQTKDYIIGICCFSTKNTALEIKSKDQLAQNQDNIWSDLTTHRHHENIIGSHHEIAEKLFICS